MAQKPHPDMTHLKNTRNLAALKKKQALEAEAVKDPENKCTYDPHDTVGEAKLEANCHLDPNDKPWENDDQEYKGPTCRP